MDAKNALDDFRAEPRAVNPEGVVSHYEWAVKAKALKIQKHSKMLQWIEQHRKAMTKKQTASNHTTTEQEHPRTIPSPTSLPTSPKHRRRGRKPRPPLSPIPSALTKKRHQKRSTQLQGFDVKQVTEKLAADSCTTAEPKAPERSKLTEDLKRKSARCRKGSTPLRPLPQRVSKSSQSTGRLKRPKATLQSLRGVEKPRRSGRTIQRPNRYGFRLG